MRDEKVVRLFGHPTLFRSGQNVAAPVWVLIVDDHQYDERSYALAFTDLLKAQKAMQDKIEEAEGACEC